MSASGGFNPTDKELDQMVENVKDMFKKFDYPITDKLIEELKAEYRANAERKGDSWRTEGSIQGVETTYWLATVKLPEEYKEAMEEIAWAGGRLGLEDTNLRKELRDIMLVCAMIYERLRDK